MDFHKKIITKKPEETAKVGAALAHYLGGRSEPRIVCLYGELGSGKTTFTQGFARGLGITSRLLSPTFIIVRRYQIPKKEFFFYHVDLYRLHSGTQLAGVGIPEIFTDVASYTVVEWAERLGGLLPEKRIDIRCTTEQDDSHGIIMEESL